MTEREVLFWQAALPWILRIGALAVGIIIAHGIRRFWNRRPCWFFGHAKNYVAMEKTTWTNGICPNTAHRPDYHLHKTAKYNPVPIHCFVARWACLKDGCLAMGLD